MKKIGIILGTRPEIIKLFALTKLFEENNQSFFIVHTNQHYSENMDKAFFDELALPQPHYNLGIGSGAHGEMTGRMMIAMEDVFTKEQPDVILVQGDTNTVMAGALVAAKMGIKVGHIEAGLRSGDRTMPEELNRIVTDHISDFLFAPTHEQKRALREEGIMGEKIFVTGNTVVDAALLCSARSDEHSLILQAHNLRPGAYILVTLHRPATVDVPEKLRTVLEAVEKTARKYNVDVILPLHPRTKKNIEQNHISLPEMFNVIEPIGYLDMLKLQKDSFLIITDSGGLQEESCILQKKCAVARENTERPEAVDVGGCILIGNDDAQKMSDAMDQLLNKEVSWSNPFGDGTTSQQIFDIVTA